MAQDASSTIARSHDAPSTAVAEALLRTPVTLVVRRIPLDQAIDSIAAAAHVSVFYGRKAVLAARVRQETLRFERTSLADVFGQLLDGTSLRLAALAGGQLGIVTGTGATASGIITGRVTDAGTSRPIVGAVVTLDDTVRRTRTNTAGEYRFADAPAGTHKITVRYVGFNRQTKLVTVADDQTTSASFALQATANTLDQVVVTATGEQRIRELGHVVARVNVDSLVREAPITDITELLQSRVPGLQVLTSNGGMAGADMSLRLRGTSTFNLDPEPIVIVDGVRYRSNNLLTNNDVAQVDQRGKGDLHSPLNDLNPNDIETIEVAKGPSASTLYGPDASNGVIVITTKRGKAGRPELRWYARPVTNTIPKNVIGQAYHVFAHQSDGSPYPDNGCTLVLQYKYQLCTVDSIRLAPSAVDYNQYSILAKSRTAWQYGASLGGGSSALRYFGSTNVNSQTGILQVPPAAQEVLKQQLGTSVLNDAFKDPNKLKTISMRASLGADINAKATASVVSAYVNTGHRRVEAGEFSSQFLRGATASLPGRDSTQIGEYINPFYAVVNTEDTDNRFTGSAIATYQLLPWLSASGTAGVDIGIATTHSFEAANLEYDGAPAYATDDRRENTDRTFDAGLTATTRAGMFSFRTSVRAQYQYAHMDGAAGYGYNLAPGSSITNTAERQSFNQLWSEQVTLGTYGEEVIGLHDRVFLTGSLRYDGSTSFGDKYDPQPYPKVGVSWIVSDEPLWQRSSLLSQFVHELRFRGSYGAASRYPTTTMKIGDIAAFTYTFNGASAAYFQRGTLANPALRPEQSREREIGLDATLLRNATLGLTWYHRKVLDQLQQIYGNVVGLNTYWENTASTLVHGVEATLQVPLIDQRAMRIDLNVAYAYNTSKVLGLGAAFERKDFWGRGYAVGYPIGSVFGQPVIDVSDSAKARGIVFPEDIIRDSTVRFLGVIIPPHTLTFTPSAQFFGGQIRVSTMIDRQTGFLRTSYGCANALCLEPYLASTPLLEQARAIRNDGADVLEPGDFTRWRELNITVEVPQHLLRALHFGRTSVSLQGRDLGLWTKQRYKGPDPESLSSLFGSSLGDATGIPQPRVWSFRFDVTP